MTDLTTSAVHALEILTDAGKTVPLVEVTPDIFSAYSRALSAVEELVETLGG